MERTKRVVAVHDISCVGRCSLTVALPVISACGIECSSLPTAVLSTHTWNFTGFTYRDLTSDIIPILDHWKSLSLKADAVYTGFLGSLEQIDMVKEMFRYFSAGGAMIIADPVMADDGKLYPVFDDKFVVGMRSLCCEADLIVPNLTEAALLTEGEYIGSDHSKSYIENMLKALSSLGPRMVVLTGVNMDGKLGAAAYDRETGEITYILDEQIPGQYHGTGDVFSSALTSALMRGKTLAKACDIAVKYTVSCIKRTRAINGEPRFGVDFEREIPYLLSLLGPQD